MFVLLAGTAVHAQDLVISDAFVLEGNAGTTLAVFNVTLLGLTPQVVSVSFTTEDGTATVADGDYVATSGTLVFPMPGSQQVAVEVFGDQRVEGDDVFLVTLFNPVNGNVLDGEGQGTIFNDDFFELAVSDVAVDEGDAGTTNAVFSITLSSPSANPVAVAYSTRNGTAIAGSDYAAAAGTLLFAPGQTQRTLPVAVFGDTLVENDETFFVDVEQTGMTLKGAPPPSGTGTIVNDDEVTLPALSIGDAVVAEGDSETVEAAFKVTLSAASNEPVTVAFATRDGSATAGADYLAGAGTLTFAPGETQREVVVEVLGDVLVEGDETFFVDLSNAAGATIADGEGQGTIDDDDAAGLSIGDATVTEGDAGGTVQAAFEVTLTPASAQGVTVDFATRDGTAVAGADYTAASGTVTFAAGETSQTVTVTVLGDQVVEGDETFFVDLSDPDGAEIADGEGQGTITDDDVASFSIGDATVGEGDGGAATQASFEVTLSSAAARTLTVDFATADGTATNNVDYAMTTGTLAFPPGVTTGRVTVLVIDDFGAEDDETFFVDLANPSGGAVIGDGRGLGTIVDDDDAQRDRIRFARVPATMEGAGTAAVAVERLGAARQAARVTVRALAGTATAGADFTAATGVLEWAAGEVGERVFAVEIRDDVLEEADETVVVALSDAAGAVLEGATRRDLVIVDDDTPMALAALGDAERTAGAGDEVELQVRATRDDGSPVSGASVAWSVEGGAELGDGELTTTGEDGVTTQRLVLGVRPGEVTVVARIAGLEVAVSFRITVEGRLGDRVDRGRDPGTASVADTLDTACAAALGGLGGLCDYVYGLDGPDQDRILAELTPKEAAAQGTIALESQRTQLRNLAARMSAVRRGARGGGGSQLAVTLRGIGLDADGLLAALRGRSGGRGVLPAALPVPGDPDFWLDGGLGADAGVRFVRDDGAALDDSGLDDSMDDVDTPADFDDGASRLGLFVNGQASFGDRPTVAGETGFDFDTAGVTAGVDYRLRNDCTFGVALGYLSDDVELRNGGGTIDIEGTSLSLYGTWYRKQVWIDGILSYGQNSLDTRRGIDFLGTRYTASGSSDGNQLAAGLGVGYDASFGSLTLGGFGRADWVDADVDAFAESGAPGFDLAIDSQQVDSLLAQAGLQLSYSASVSWGVVLPTLRLTQLHEFRDDGRPLRARFVDDPGGTRFTLFGDDPDRDFSNLGLGVSAVFRRGRQAFVFYEKDFGRDDLSFYRITAGLRLEF